MHVKTRGVLLLTILALVTLSLSPVSAGAEGKIKVVATFSILGDLIQNVGGEHIELRTLVPLNGDPHTFEPSPVDSVALVEAALIFEIGLEFEQWLDKLYESSGSGALRVVVTQGIEPLHAAEGEHDHDHDDDKGAPEATKDAVHEHEHGEFDPHVWHDVRHAMHMVGVIRDALVEADAANAEVYRANAGAYLAQLEELDAWVIEQVDALPAARRILITSHDAFSYFGHRYGFKIDSALGITTEAADPPPAKIAELIETIRAAGVPAIFAETQSNPRLMAQIAREAGVTLGPELYAGSLGEPGSEADTYLKMVRHNVTAMVEALSR